MKSHHRLLGHKVVRRPGSKPLCQCGYDPFRANPQLTRFQVEQRLIDHRIDTREAQENEAR